MAYKNIALNTDYHPKLEELAKKFSGENKGKLIEIMINYFDTLGLDPTDLESGTFNKEFTKLKNELSKLRETTVSFIKQQEKGLLTPLINQVNTNTQELMNYLAAEPLTVKHLDEFKKTIGISQLQKSSPEPKKQETIENDKTISAPNTDNEALIQNIKSKAEITISHARDLFRDFLATGKNSPGKGMFFDQPVINMYKGEFERLKLKA